MNSPERGIFSPVELCTSGFFFSSAASLTSSLSFSPVLRQLSKQRQQTPMVQVCKWAMTPCSGNVSLFGLFLDETEAGLESLLGSHCGEFPLLLPHNSDTACNSHSNDCGIQEIPVQCCDKFLFEFFQDLGFFINNLIQ